VALPPRAFPFDQSDEGVRNNAEISLNPVWDRALATKSSSGATVVRIVLVAYRSGTKFSTE
jgi:hypothetical protein